MAGAEVVRPGVVRLRLTQPTGPILTWLAFCGSGVVPRAAVQAGHDLNREPIGSGPFRLATGRIEADALSGTVRLVRHGRQNLDAIEFVTIADDAERAAALLEGRVHLDALLSPRAWTAVAGAPNVVASSVQDGRWHWLMVNCRDPLLSDVRVRRAVSAAIDRRALIDDGFEGHGLTLERGVFAPWSWAYADDLPDVGERRRSGAGACPARGRRGRGEHPDRDRVDGEHAHRRARGGPDCRPVARRRPRRDRPGHGRTDVGSRRPARRHVPARDLVLGQPDQRPRRLRVHGLPLRRAVRHGNLRLRRPRRVDGRRAGVDRAVGADDGVSPVPGAWPSSTCPSFPRSSRPSCGAGRRGCATSSRCATRSSRPCAMPGCQTRARPRRPTGGRLTESPNLPILHQVRRGPSTARSTLPTLHGARIWRGF